MAAKKAKKVTKGQRPMRSAKKGHTLSLMAGVEGTALYLNGCRIAGPKPWGGGVVLDEWEVSDEDLKTAMRHHG
jgi:hypothetical protein